MTHRALSSILTEVAGFSRRASALLVVLALTGGNVTLCAGWIPTPEARMACCSELGACPMHKSGTHGSPSERRITQAEADSCCAASEQGDTAPLPSSLAFFVSLAVVPSPVPLLLPETAAQPDAWRTMAPPPGSHVHKHLLLSVLLV